jgi:hypothetical protein
MFTHFCSPPSGPSPRWRPSSLQQGLTNCRNWRFLAFSRRLVNSPEDGCQPIRYLMYVMNLSPMSSTLLPWSYHGLLMAAPACQPERGARGGAVLALVCQLLAAEPAAGRDVRSRANPPQGRLDSPAIPAIINKLGEKGRNCPIQTCWRDGCSRATPRHGPMLGEIAGNRQGGFCWSSLCSLIFALLAAKPPHCHPPVVFMA